MSFIPIVCPPGSGSGGAGADVENFLLCDVLNGEIVGTAIAVYEYDSDGNPVGPPTFIDPNTGAPYVAQGTLQPCPEGSQNEFVLCDVQPDGSSTQFIRKLIQSATGQILEVQDQLLDGSTYVPTGTVGLCDPYTTCTPTADQDLNGDCGPGEAADQVIIEDDSTHPLANAVFEDDPSADALCGGQWNNPAAALPPGFPVSETFRNATFDQPGPIIQGSGPTSAPPTYPLLTADPANAGEGNPAIATDAAGAGWLRVADIDSNTNGLWQVPGPFPTSQGMSAQITHASHDGTTPGGDGMAFVFTDGSVAPQSAAVGGFGNLGLQNWEGGYVAVVLDEYGQTCTCNQQPPPIITGTGGPCGFCTNTISIQLAGASRIGAGCGCCTIASASLNPKAINLTTRSQPLVLHVSIIEEGGQTYVSAGIDWNDGNGVIQYFDRVNVTACAGAPPATLRMAAYGGSGGAFRAVKEFRDAMARPAGSSQWRAFPITTDPIPACVTLLNIEATVDVTFNSDTQTTGNGDPEVYFWLVNEATNTVIDRAQKSSTPAQVGVPDTLTISASIPPADLPNIRIYVGSESRDQNGEYDTLWENLEVNVNGTGCPAQQRRTLEISARCPIPVFVVGGGDGEGGGGGSTIVNTPATFEDAPICATVNGVVQSAFRREVRAADGTVTVTFLGQDGLPITPTSWTPGDCAVRDPEVTVLCDDNGEFLRVFTFDFSGAIVSTDDYTLLGAPYVPTGTPGDCGLGIAVSTRCMRDNLNIPFTRAYIFTEAGAPTSFFDFDEDGNPFVPAPGPLFPCDTLILQDTEQEVLCDDNGPFIRRFSWATNSNGLGPNPPTVTDWTLASPSVPYVPVGTVEQCPIEVVAEVTPFDVEQECFVDNNGVVFYRTYVFTDGTGIPTVVGNFDQDGAPFVPAVGPGFPRPCADGAIVYDIEQQILCDSNGTQFLRTYHWDENNSGQPVQNFEDWELDGTTPFIPVGPVGLCSSDTSFADRERICYTLTSTGDDVNVGWARHDDNIPNTPQTPNGIAFFDALGNPIDPTLDGFTQVVCENPDPCCPIVVSNVCLANGNNGVVIRNADGTLSYIDTETGGAFNPANDIVPCATLTTQATNQIDSTVQRQTNAGSIVIAAGARAVSLAVLSTATAGVTINLGQGVTTIPPGVSLSWGVDDREEQLLDSFTFTGVAGSDFIVTSTRQ